MREVWIVGAARTPIGAFQGVLASVPAPVLGAAAVKAALERASTRPDDVEEVLIGNVLQAGVGQAPARQVSLGAGIPNSVPATTINKVCGSGLKTVMLAAQAVGAGEADVVVAGGIESMSNVPYYLEKGRGGYRLGHGQLVDGLIKDGLWDVYNNFHMGSAAELCARECAVTREAQDEYAYESYRRARVAIETGAFRAEIVPIEVAGKKGSASSVVPAVTVATDEEPFAAPIEKLATLRPVFDAKGTVTAGNASKLNDGAAAVVVMAAEVARQRGLQPLAKIIAYGQAAQASEWFTTAPTIAIERTLARAGLTKGEIDLWEINEAFAVVALANNRKLGLDAARVNVNGGAVALGHPIGASGTRILVTLLFAMQARNVRRGVASLCIGGGEAVAMVVERATL